MRVPTDDVAPLYAYEFRYPIRLRYEDWIANANIPSALVDVAEQNDGLNNDWAWLQQGNWNVYLSIYSNTTRLGETALYKNSFPIQVMDYFEQGLDAYQEFRAYDYVLGNPLYLGVDSDGIDNNAILENGITKYEIDTILNTGCILPLVSTLGWIFKWMKGAGLNQFALFRLFMKERQLTRSSLRAQMVTY